VFNLFTLLFQSDEAKEQERLDELSKLSGEISAIFEEGDNAQIAAGMEQTLTEGASKRQLLLDELQIDASSYNSDIEEAIGNFSQGGLTGRLNEMPDYNASSIITLLGDNQDIVNILLINYLINIVEGGDSTSFTDYLTTNEGQEQVEIALNSVLLEETSFYGLIGTSANTGTTTAADIVSRLNEAAGNTTVPDDPSGTEEKVEDISDAVAKQCVLLQLLQPLSDFYDESLKEIISGDIPYSGRILKLNCNEPSNFINYVSGVPRLAESFTEIRKSRSDEVTEVLTPLNEFRLSFIKDHENQLIELPIFYNGDFNHSVLGGDPPTTSEAVEASIDTEDDSSGAGGVGEDIDAAPTPADGPIELKPIGLEFLSSNTTDAIIDVVYEGTNPATYRNDVQVTISLTSNTLQLFMQNWRYEGLTDENNMSIPFNLFDLILFPNLEKDANGYGRIFKSQFSPSYNRLRLAYISNIHDSNSDFSRFYKKNCNVLDLTPIDHELKRDEEGKNYVLSITYRGYVQSVLTSPETDALSDSVIKATRAERDVLIQRAVEKGCSLKELQKIRSALTRFALTDVEGVSDRMLTNLFQRAEDPNVSGRGIFKLVVDQTINKALRNDDRIKLNSLKKRLTTLDKTVVNSVSSFRKTSIAETADTSFEDINAKDNENIYFFYLADLLDTILIQSSLFNNREPFVDPTNEKVMRQQLRFLMGPFRDPDDNIINIGNIPISVDFFKEWYQENVTQKELYVYPCLSFIRDMTERVVTNLLNEVCFEATEDTQLLIRSSFFSGVKTPDSGDRIVNACADAYSQSNTKKFDIDDNLNTLTDDLPMVQVGFRDNVKNYINYCVINARQNRSDIRSGALTVEVPEFVLEGNFLGSQKADFSRTTQPGYRESRYFRGGASGITMLAGVYNVTLKLDRPIHTFYPNQIIRISINDNGQSINVGGTSKSIFTELGLNGFYTITKVKTTVSPREGIDSTTIEALWISSEDPYYNLRPVSTNSKSITDPTQTAKNALCNAYGELAKEIGFREQIGQTPSEIADQIDEEYNKVVGTVQQGTEQ